MSYGQFAYYYDRLMEDMPYPQWLHFIEQCWARHGKPSSVVELGCGTGNLSIPLAERGYEVTGIDLSAHMLAVARQKQDEAGIGMDKLQWIEQNMTTWMLPQQVDAVISCCDSLNYVLEPPQIEATFRQTYDGLVDKGTFIFDVHTKYTFDLYAEQQPFTLNEEHIAYIWHCYLDEKNYEIEHELTIFAEDERSEDTADSASFHRIDEVHIQRAYDLQWLTEALHRAGFAHVESYADFTFDQPNETTGRAFFIAVK